MVSNVKSKGQIKQAVNRFYLTLSGSKFYSLPIPWVGTHGQGYSILSGSEYTFPRILKKDNLSKKCAKKSLPDTSLTIPVRLPFLPLL